MMKKKRLFCELGPVAYAISVKKQIFQRKFQDYRSKDKFAHIRTDSLLPVVISSHETHMIKRGPGIDPQLQYNKADNIRLACSRINGVIVKPGETFSFWRLVGKTSKRNGFSDGRVLVNGKLIAGVGGGLCNLANTLHLIFMHSPVEITELHHHSDALSPDEGGVRVPYSAGTSVNYNYIDLRFRNVTDYDIQVVAYCEGDNLKAELRATKEPATSYRIVEEEHHFRKEANGNYYRISKIYRETIEKSTGEVIDKSLKWDNRSKVMFNPDLIPPELIKNSQE